MRTNTSVCPAMHMENKGIGSKCRHVKACWSCARACDGHLLRPPAPELGEAMGLCHAEYSKHASQSQAGRVAFRTREGQEPGRLAMEVNSLQDLTESLLNCSSFHGQTPSALVRCSRPLQSLPPDPVKVSCGIELLVCCSPPERKGKGAIPSTCLVSASLTSLCMRRTHIAQSKVQPAQEGLPRA